MSLYSVRPVPGPVGCPEEYCTNWPTFSSRVILWRRASIFFSVEGSTRLEWGVAEEDPSAEGESCAVAAWLQSTRHATIANRISEVSTLSKTRMVLSDVCMNRPLSTEIRIKSHKRGWDDQGRQTILNSRLCYQQNPYSWGIFTILNTGKFSRALSSSTERA